MPSVAKVRASNAKTVSISMVARRSISESESTSFIVRTMKEVLSDSLMLRRATMLMLTVFALLALTLATLGIYGLTSYSVSRRTHEIGLRVALGASRPQILRLVVGRELITSIIGAAIGVGAAFILTRGLSAMLYHVTATDPLVFVCM